jgi:hypothetical protein
MVKTNVVRLLVWDHGIHYKATAFDMLKWQNHFCGPAISVSKIKLNKPSPQGSVLNISPDWWYGPEG